MPVSIIGRCVICTFHYKLWKKNERDFYVLLVEKIFIVLDRCLEGVAHAFEYYVAVRITLT